MLTVDFARLGVSHGMTMLDLGCGAGRHTYEALRRGATVVAADLDAPLLREVAEMAAEMALEGELPPGAGYSFVEADARRLPFEDETFDRIVVSEVLEHIQEDEPAMAEIRRVLKPSGRAAITVPRWWPERVCWALSDEYHSNDGGHVRIYTAEELVTKLRRNGLTPAASHHAHALHSPYWWVKCAVGVRRDSAPLARAYRRFLEWQIAARPRTLDVLERGLNPVLGKSLVVYVEKAPVHAHV